MQCVQDRLARRAGVLLPVELNGDRATCLRPTARVPKRTRRNLPRHLEGSPAICDFTRGWLLYANLSERGCGEGIAGLLCVAARVERRVNDVEETEQFRLLCAGQPFHRGTGHAIEGGLRALDLFTSPWAKM